MSNKQHAELGDSAASLDTVLSLIAPQARAPHPSSTSSSGSGWVEYTWVINVDGDQVQVDEEDDEGVGRFATKYLFEFHFEIRVDQWPF